MQEWGRGKNIKVQDLEKTRNTLVFHTQPSVDVYVALDKKSVNPAAEQTLKL